EEGQRPTYGRRCELRILRRLARATASFVSTAHHSRGLV
ncbi:MAG: hypothetical protein AVDCRST_MAG78-2520, partial [uncultured Rubrobacteraceae bacterium]